MRNPQPDSHAQIGKSIEAIGRHKTTINNAANFNQQNLAASTPYNPHYQSRPKIGRDEFPLVPNIAFKTSATPHFYLLYDVQTPQSPERGLPARSNARHEKQR